MHYFVWNIDPIALKMGAISIHWYGIFFASGLIGGLYLFRYILRLEHKDPDMAEALLGYLTIGIIIGARLAHCLIYEPDYYLSHPLEILFVWKGGLASHGGLVGAIIATAIFSKRYNISLSWLLSRLSVVGGVFATAVRIGNFFNSEILGRVSDTPWSVIFLRYDNLPRHPVQLYEALSYLAITIIMWILYKRYAQTKRPCFLTGVFFTLIFTSRFLLEYLKLPQADYSLSIGLSVGQILSIPFILLGIAMTIYGYSVVKYNNSIKK